MAFNIPTQHSTLTIQHGTNFIDHKSCSADAYVYKKYPQRLFTGIADRVVMPF